MDADKYIEAYGDCDIEKVGENLVQAFGTPKNRKERMNLENLAAIIWGRMANELDWYLYNAGPFDWLMIRQWHGDLF